MLNLILTSIRAFADEAAPPAAAAAGAVGNAAQQAPGWMQFVPLAFILVVMYFVVLRPQAKKQKETADFLSALRVGDNVVTSSGIMGRVTALADAVVTLEVANQTQMKFLKSHILMSQAALQAAAKKEGK